MQRFMQGFTCGVPAVVAFTVPADYASTGSGQAMPSETGLSVDISRTRFGTPHIRANDYAGLGFGMAYAYAQDNICLLTDQVVIINDGCSKIFGPDGMVVVSFKPTPDTQIDIFFRGAFDKASLHVGYTQMSPEARKLLRGYIAGYNRYLKDMSAVGRPTTCHNADWACLSMMADMMLMGEEKAIQVSASAILQSIVAAQPPGDAPASAVAPPHAVDTAAFDRDLQLCGMPIGSNDRASGKAATDNGRGVLLGNPYFPWITTNRSYQVHLTVSGELDMMDTSIATFPVIGIGFNRDVAWTHTASTGRHFTLFELKLAENDPTTHLIDGRSHEMTTRIVAFDVKLPDGRLERRIHIFYNTMYGPASSVSAGGMPWASQKAYTLCNTNRDNTHSIDTWLYIAQATDVTGIRQIIGNLGIPWVNMVTTDRGSHALSADVSTTPGVLVEALRRYTPLPLTNELFKGVGLVLPDGSRGTCDWQTDLASPVPGLVAPARMLVSERDDYVVNNNDGSQSTSPAQRLTGFLSVASSTDVSQRLRIRTSITEIKRHLDGTDGLSGNKVDVPSLQVVIFRDASLAGHLVRDGLLAACKGTSDLSANICDGRAALTQWNFTDNISARATYLFCKFWMHAKDTPHVYAIDFNPVDPIHTPCSLHMSDAAIRTAVLEASRDAVGAARVAGFAPDAPLSVVQVTHTSGGDIALHGGEEYEGVLNRLQGMLIGPKGLQAYFGTSYIRAVTFGSQGPATDTLLTYGESTDPVSPYALDQMHEFSAKRWNRLPFSEATIATDPALGVIKLLQ